ncbi:putative Uncharacterized transposase-like protein [Monocercomonoides exilis]|uniref:putative Uncharacterized transposase-like protein n=1 Tax=Monocercomonoides exilis TaxID=2049356 RepID=UPI003559B02C|nr:putative Uncharacterized transposase-like protein [Monocercomonoides exilis]|eukprot:MONOS_4054.1-p1 / transcript=MONOS_4054.1 / gene=MONOS_4054 / organism=Monocercomonoides_exilis_PA203 / gene_product=Uncharacterized transposase-like protein HI1328.1 / transcript_product=Uncharacterized transposase-like protein HI1328.1 / location=Mono_scaffold00103:30635-31264(+) / protein_length=209 / sequence_SO=supercontig / SO=protein_coding / is_pseudo=false
MNVWNESQVQIGGEGKTVEIDEAVRRRRKFKRGRRKEQIWIFGGEERLEGGGAGPRFVMIAPNRRIETLLPIILERIRPGTTIMSDEWNSYSTLNLHNYTHKTVCHKRHFVDPESGACTNTIEGFWGTLRKSFPLHGVRKSLIPDHLAMQMVKSSKDYEFSDILMHISYYKPVEPQAPEPEPDTEDEDTDIPGIDDIFHEESVTKNRQD